MTDAIQAAAYRILEARGIERDAVCLHDAPVVARAYLDMLAFHAGKAASGENAGVTQPSAAREPPPPALEKLVDHLKRIKYRDGCGMRLAEGHPVFDTAVAALTSGEGK